MCEVDTVTPAKAGVQERLQNLDSCFRRNDGEDAHNVREPSGFFNSDSQVDVILGNYLDLQRDPCEGYWR